MLEVSIVEIDKRLEVKLKKSTTRRRMSSHSYMNDHSFADKVVQAARNVAPVSQTTAIGSHGDGPISLGGTSMPRSGNTFGIQEFSAATPPASLPRECSSSSSSSLPRGDIHRGKRMVDGQDSTTDIKKDPGDGNPREEPVEMKMVMTFPSLRLSRLITTSSLTDGPIVLDPQGVRNAMASLARIGTEDRSAEEERAAAEAFRRKDEQRRLEERIREQHRREQSRMDILFSDSPPAKCPPGASTPPPAGAILNANATVPAGPSSGILPVLVVRPPPGPRDNARALVLEGTQKKRGGESGGVYDGPSTSSDTPNNRNGRDQRNSHASLVSPPNTPPSDGSHSQDDLLLRAIQAGMVVTQDEELVPWEEDRRLLRGLVEVFVSVDLSSAASFGDLHIQFLRLGYCHHHHRLVFPPDVRPSRRNARPWRGADSFQLVIERQGAALEFQLFVPTTCARRPLTIKTQCGSPSRVVHRIACGAPPREQWHPSTTSGRP